MLAAVMTGWVVGYVIGAVVVVLVALLVGTLIHLTRRIARQAAQIEEALEASRQNTDALWKVGTVRDLLGDTVDHAASLRRALGG